MQTNVQASPQSASCSGLTFAFLQPTNDQISSAWTRWQRRLRSVRRAYAGAPSNGGRYFRVGAVPMYAYLASLDIDEVGFTLRTASLMTQPEFHLDVANPGDLALFGIRYLIVPAQKTRPPTAPGVVLILRDSRYWVYELSGISYIQVVDTVGSIATNRVDLGSRTAPYLYSALPGQGRYLTVGYAGARPATPTVRPGARPAGLPGKVVTEHADLADGRASAVVHVRRRAVVVLSASYDPGWSATVDGRPARVQMLAPAVMGVAVPPGTHHIAFRYTGFGGYPPLLALAVLDLLAVAVLTRRRRMSAGAPGSQITPESADLPVNGHRKEVRTAEKVAATTT